MQLSHYLVLKATNEKLEDKIQNLQVLLLLLLLVIIVVMILRIYDLKLLHIIIRIIIIY